MGCDRKREMCDINEYFQNYNMMNKNWNFPSELMYGHSYVLNQKYKGNSFTPQEGLQMGTMFPELVSPYSPLNSMKVIETLRNERRDY